MQGLNLEQQLFFFTGLLKFLRLEHRWIWNQDTWEVGSRLFSHRKKYFQSKDMLSAQWSYGCRFDNHSLFFLFVLGVFFVKFEAHRRAKAQSCTFAQGTHQNKQREQEKGNGNWSATAFSGFMNMYFTSDTCKAWIIVEKNKTKFLPLPLRPLRRFPETHVFAYWSLRAVKSECIWKSTCTDNAVSH